MLFAPTDQATYNVDFPWSLQHILPFWAGADHHDFHHMAFVDNFASSFRWWDRGLGTDKRYQAYKARMQATRSKGLSEEARKQLEDRINEETEREGFAAEQLVEGKVVKVE
jgi:methylsterol monooxygenase